MNWSVYMILSSNRSLYTGITTDVRRRWRQHSGEIKGGARFFNGRKPVALAYLETGHDRSSATRRELEIKALSRKEKEALQEKKQNRARDYASEIPVL